MLYDNINCYRILNTTRNYYVCSGCFSRVIKDNTKNIIPAMLRCGSTYLWKLGFTNENHCLMHPSISRPRSRTSRVTCYGFSISLDTKNLLMEDLLRLDKHRSASASAKIFMSRSSRTRGSYRAKMPSNIRT